MLKLMYITNRPEVAQIAEEAGVDWIFVDMEYIGKSERQRGLDTVQNHHTIEDIHRVKAVLSRSKVIVRVNPIHEKREDWPSSAEEIALAIGAGADIVMLPFFHTVDEVEKFVSYVDGKAKTCLLLETPEAAVRIDEILQVPGVDMIHIGLNDLHLALGMKFMFQPLADGIVDNLARKIKAKGIPFGFGGIAKMNTGLLPGSAVLKEHYRLGSSMVIVSRSFCNTDEARDLDAVREEFVTGIRDMRAKEVEAQGVLEYFSRNHNMVEEIVSGIVESNKPSKL